MAQITENLIDEIIQGIGQSGKPYYYDFPKGYHMDAEVRRIATRVNRFLVTYQNLTGKAIGSLEKLQQLLEQGTDLWNEESFRDTVVRDTTANKQKFEYGVQRDKPLPFFGVDLTDTGNAELFLTALKPLYDSLGCRVLSDQFGYTKKRYKMQPLSFGDKFDIHGNELVTTNVHAEERDNACKRYATTPEQISRVKVALDFIKPFKEMERHIIDKDVVLKKSYVQELGLPYPVCLVRVSGERKELMPNPEFVENIKIKPVPKTIYNKLAKR